jgi:hypothetical protein
VRLLTWSWFRDTSRPVMTSVLSGGKIIVGEFPSNHEDIMAAAKFGCSLMQRG